jgi:hypothetical protein
VSKLAALSLKQAQKMRVSASVTCLYALNAESDKTAQTPKQSPARSTAQLWLRPRPTTHNPAKGPAYQFEGKGA